MKKLLWLLFFYPCLVFGQANSSLLAQNNAANANQFTSTSLAVEPPINMDEFSEALELFYTSWKQRMIISSDVFDPMKLLIDRNLPRFINKVNKNSENQFKLLSGNLSGGALSDSPWRISGAKQNTELNRFYLDYFTIVSSFKQAMEAQSAPECKECETLVKTFYQSFVTKTSLPDAEFSELKSKVELCNNQRKTECLKNKTVDMLKVLNGDSEGGPLSGSKWRLKELGGQRQQVPFEKLNTTFTNGDVIVKYNDKRGVIDKNGFLFLRPQYNQIKSFTYQSISIYVVKLNNKWGIYSLSGKQLIPLEYDLIQGFQEGDNTFLAYKKENKWGIISNGLTQISSANYEDIAYNLSWISFKEGGKIGFLNKDGSVAIAPKYDVVGADFESLFPSKMVLPVILSGKVGLINRNHTEIIPPTYDRVGYYGDNKNKGAKVGFIPVYLNGKVGYINQVGTVLVEPKYDIINGFGLTGYGLEKVSYVKLADKWGLLDNSTGKEITPLKYDELFGFSDKHLSAGFKEGSKFGLISIDGRELVPAKYDAVYNFWDNNLAAIKLNGLLGLINTKGDVLIEPRFQSLDLLTTGLFISKLNNKIGLLNTSGQELIAPKFDEILAIDNGMYPTRIGAKWGYLNENGSEVVQPIFDSKVSFQDNIASVQSNGVSYKINKSGQRVLNNFSSSSLRELTLGDQTIYDLAASRMAEVYKEALNKLILESMLGSGSTNATFAQIANQKNGLQNDIRGWIGGNMTSSQQAEFNQIAQDAEANFKLSMSTLTSAFRSTAPGSNATRQGSTTNTCKWCSIRFTGLGYNYRYYGGYTGLKIFEGKREDPMLVGGNVPGCFHSAKCAEKAYYAGQKNCDSF